MNLCELCQKDELTAEERIEHLAQLLEDSGYLQAFQIFQGQTLGAQNYLNRGGRVHLKESELFG